MSAFGSGKLALGAAGATALVTLLAGCGSSSSGVAPAAAGSSSAVATGSAAALQTKSTSIGTVLVDPSGHTVYELVGATASNTMCSGGCLSIWPAVTANGTQVVVNGHPAFTFTADTAAGQTKGQGVTDQWGRWLALDASGNPINAPAAPASKAPRPPRLPAAAAQRFSS